MYGYQYLKFKTAFTLIKIKIAMFKNYEKKMHVV